MRFIGETADSTEAQRATERLIELIRVRIHMDSSALSHLHEAIGWDVYAEPIIVGTARRALEQGLLEAVMSDDPAVIQVLGQRLDEIIEDVFMQPYREAIEYFKADSRAGEY